MNYFGAFIYKQIPINKNTILGIQTATKGDMSPFTEKEVEKVENRMYKELNPNPAPRCMPIPPRTFRDDKATPIKVIINAARGIENRL